MEPILAMGYPSRVTHRAKPSSRRPGPQGGVTTVLQVLPALEAGGVERGTVDVAVALVAAGFRAIVASAGGRMVREIERGGGQHVALPLASKNPFVMRANARSLAELIGRERVDLVHARSRAPAFSARAAARRNGRPFVTTVHGVYNAATPIKRAYNAIMAKGDRVIAISDFVAEHVRGRYRVGDDRLRVVPRGIDTELFDPGRVGAERVIALARRWHLPDGASVVLMPARPARWKGHPVLIEAAARMIRRDAVILMVGLDEAHDRYRRELDGRLRAHGLAGVIRLMEPCNDMPAAYMLADVVVCPSTDPEAFGRVAVEAQAMGRPVISSDHGAARETVAAGETGWLCPPGNASALGAAIDAALALDAEARARMAERARARVLAKFDRSRMCAATIEVYRDLLGRRTP
jgi:glycosyltransferase involved in cell wall biosynthesis